MYVVIFILYFAIGLRSCYYHELILSMLQLVDAIRHCIDFSTTCKTLQSLELLDLDEDQRGKS